MLTFVIVRDTQPALPYIRHLAAQDDANVVEIDAIAERTEEEGRALRERAMFAPSGRIQTYLVTYAQFLKEAACTAVSRIADDPPKNARFFFVVERDITVTLAFARLMARGTILDLSERETFEFDPNQLSLEAMEAIDGAPQA